MAKTHSKRDKSLAPEANGHPGISLGEKLRQYREARGLSLEDVFEKTKLRPSMLEAIEQERWQELPAPAFVKGFLRTYARVLDIDEQEIIDLYEAGLPKESRPFEAILTKKRRRRSGWVVAVVMMLVLFGVTYWWIEQPPPGVSTQGPAPGLGMQSLGQDQRQEMNPDLLTTEETADTTVRQQNSKAEEKPPEVAPEASIKGLAEKTVPAPVEAKEEQGAMVSDMVAPLVLKGFVKERTWMRVTTDGGQPKEYIFDPGSKPVWKAQRVFDIMVGNAAGIELELNDKPLGPLGRRGKVIHLVLPKE